MEETKQLPEIAITDRMYAAYGTDTGILFGIPADLRWSVEAIVKIAIEESAAPEQQAKIDRLEAEKEIMAQLSDVAIKRGDKDTVKIARLESQIAELLDVCRLACEQLDEWGRGENKENVEENSAEAYRTIRAAIAKHEPK